MRTSSAPQRKAYAWAAATDLYWRRSPGWTPSLASSRRICSAASTASSDQGSARAAACAASTSSAVIAVESFGAWSRVQSSFLRPAIVMIGRTALRNRNRSSSAVSSLPVSGEGHSFEAATQSRSGTGTDTPSFSNVRSLSIRSRVFRMAEDAFQISSTNASSASGRRPVGDAAVAVLLEGARSRSARRPPRGW